ncbi:hypothetical protein DVA86_33250 [Streptomyces armeniacus]|uniref:DUF1023 domain-containing protein n=1 Tax=Streptomyces armeniacus TaxID=83291 RepID=A0A345XYJ0_9ACTN|nr:alpha/beta hydrolase [Streptomyces armeniacus]AXK36706.1 hypothetical protein DVA86_33250 [Streptomyces armeniacus]
MDYKTLDALKPSEFEDAAGGYRSASDMASQAKDGINNQISVRMRAELTGQARDAALGQLKELSKNFHYAQVECGLVSTALNALAADLRAAKAKLDGAVADARAQKFTVNPDGSVSYPPAGDKVDGKVPEGSTVTGSPNGKGGGTTLPIDPSGTANDLSDALERQARNAHPNPNYGAALEYANRIATAVQEATEADEKWAPKLRELKADDDLTVSHSDWADAGRDMGGVKKSAADYLADIKPPPKDGTPKENAEWWKGLSAEERDAYVTLNPSSVGALDGVPSEVRDEANRTVLAEARGKYELDRAAIPPEPKRYIANPTGSYPAAVESAAWKQWNEKYGDRRDQLDKSLNGMKAIEDRFDKTGVEGLPEAYLLGFNAEGNGRAIVANGNPDTADHTAVYVPGTTSNLGKVGGDIDRMTTLWQESSAMVPGQQVSTVTWLGYDAPQSIVKDAPFSHYADDGAPAFNSFMDGLNATNTTEGGGHHTAVGHSYGTTLIGSAARQGDLNADDIVFAGSPGVQVGEASELDVPKGHVWNEEADGDKVPDIGRWGHGGEQWRLGGGVAIIPSDDLFGANQMSTDTEGHSAYWDEGTESLKNQAAVVAGQYGKATLED